MLRFILWTDTLAFAMLLGAQWIGAQAFEEAKERFGPESEAGMDPLFAAIAQFFDEPSLPRAPAPKTASLTP